MRSNIFVVLLLMTAVVLADAAPRKSAQVTSRAAQNDNTAYVDDNLLFMFVTNRGLFGTDLGNFFGNFVGAYYPYSGDIQDIYDNVNGAAEKSVMFSAGLWLGAIDSLSGDTLVVVAEYGTEYGPGPMAAGTFLADQPEFRTYKLYADSQKTTPNQDFLDYMAHAVEQGAPTRLDFEGDTVPDMVGEQMLWSVFNDADASRHGEEIGSTAPLGVEVRQTWFTLDGAAHLANTVFFRFRLYNKGTQYLNRMYTAVWCDPDLGAYDDDLVGCDTGLVLGYCYNGAAFDAQYSPDPVPAVGVLLAQGPMVYTGQSGDTGLQFSRAYPYHTNRSMTSFAQYQNGLDPDSPTQIYALMTGLKKDGSPYIYNGDTLTFMRSGNPATGLGDLDSGPEDRRFMLTTGPIDLRPGDSTELIGAMVVGHAVDHLTAVSVLLSYAQSIHTEYGSSIFSPCCEGVRGDVNYDGQHDPDVSDIVALVEYSFTDPPGPPPRCYTEADVNGDMSVDVTDVVYLVEYSFSIIPGPPPLPCE